MSQSRQDLAQIRRSDARRNHVRIVDEARRLVLLGERATIARVATGTGLGAATVKRHLVDGRQMQRAVADRSAALLWAQVVRAERIRHPLERLEAILRLLANAQVDAKCTPTGEQVRVATMWRTRVTEVAERAFVRASQAGHLRSDASTVDLAAHHEIVQALVRGGGSRLLAQQAVSQLLRAVVARPLSVSARADPSLPR